MPDSARGRRQRRAAPNRWQSTRQRPGKSKAMSRPPHGGRSTQPWGASTWFGGQQCCCNRCPAPYQWGDASSSVEGIAPMNRSIRRVLLCLGLAFAAVSAPFAAAVDWTPPQFLNTDAPNDPRENGQGYAVAAGAGRFVAVWGANSVYGGPYAYDSDIFLTRSSDSGASWSPPTVGEQPRAGTRGDQRVAAYRDRRPGHLGVRVVHQQSGRHALGHHRSSQGCLRAFDRRRRNMDRPHIFQPLRPG